MSQRLDCTHTTWVGIVKKTGTINTGHCTCLTSLILLSSNLTRCGKICSLADVYNILFQCRPSAVVFSVLPGYDLLTPTHKSTVDEADLHFPVSLDDVYNSHSVVTLPGGEFEQLCSQVFDKLKISQEEVDFFKNVH